MFVRGLIGVLLVACTAPLKGSDDTAVPATTDAPRDTQADAPFDANACLDDPTCLHPLVVAHRGAGSDTPENSLAGLHAAADAGVSLVELDVRPTSDGVLVVMHDSDVDRTTDGTGEVSELTAAEVAALSLEDGTPPPTFVAMLEAALERDMVLYVDIKTDRTDLVVADIAQAKAQDVVLLRDGVDSLARAAAIDPTLRWLAAVDGIDGLEGATDALPGLAWVELASPVPSAEFVAAAADRGLRVQQDVFLGDVGWLSTQTADGWNRYLDAGVLMPQTDLAPALMEVVSRRSD